MKWYTELDIRLGLVKPTPEQQKFVDHTFRHHFVNAFNRALARVPVEQRAAVRPELLRLLAEQWFGRAVTGERKGGMTAAGQGKPRLRGARSKPSEHEAGGRSDQ